MSARRLCAAQRRALASAERLVGEGPHPDPPPADAEPAKFQSVWNLGTETTGFNYETLPPDDAAAARDAADRIRRLQHNERYAVGELLVALRSKFQHGQWLKWLELEVRISDQSAANYMAYYRLAQRAPAELSQLMSADAAYQVARLPEAMQDRVFGAAQAKLATGGSRRIAAREVGEIVDAWRVKEQAERLRKGGAALDEPSSGSGKGAAPDDASGTERDPEPTSSEQVSDDDRKVDHTLVMSVAMLIYHAINARARRNLYRILNKRGGDAELLRCLRRI